MSPHAPTRSLLAASILALAACFSTKSVNVIVDGGGPGSGGSLGSGGTPGTGGATSGSGGTPGTGGAGTGGTTSALTAMAPFNGRAVILGCGALIPAAGMRGCNNYPTGAASCPAEGKQTLEQFTVGGDPAITYEVTLGIRGIVEMRSYEGGARRATTGTVDSWYVGGAADTTDPAYNVYQMTVSSPAQVFYFNSAPAPAYQRRECFELNYQVTFQVRGGASVQLASSDSNCAVTTNCGPPDMPTSQCVPIVLPGVVDVRVNPQPFKGQFILIELLGARAL